MENNQEANAVPSSFTRGELLQASIDLTHHALSYVKSMALRCAVQLGVADAIRRAGGEASVDGLAAALSLAPTKLPHLRRVMRVLAASGVFAQAAGGGEGYRLTVSHPSPRCSSPTAAAAAGACSSWHGVTSMVDVAGGTGGAAKAVAAAFLHIKCTVLDLPHVVGGIPADDDGQVEFVAGDMMDFIPQADALLLKFVLHDWSDEDCLNILKRCKEAICCREQGGKLFIIEVVVGSSSSRATCHETQLLFDLFISTMVQGRERDEKEWSKLFNEAGFSRYKVTSMLDIRSVIEVFP
ncbi:unnamed protein product [Urochloa decumbens]|uniref:Uncharacterized protein n=1 Tax=Urochloa decumbens TaxID=240449 RepID=A0ABC9G8J0_9POAL